MRHFYHILFFFQNLPFDGIKESTLKHAALVLVFPKHAGVIGALIGESAFALLGAQGFEPLGGDVLHRLQPDYGGGAGLDLNLGLYSN